MKKMKIGDKVVSYVGHPIQATVKDKDKGYWGGRSNFEASNAGPSLQIADLHDAFKWMDKWSQDEDFDMGYVLDYDTMTMYYDNDKVITDAIDARFKKFEPFVNRVFVEDWMIAWTLAPNSLPDKIWMFWPIQIGPTPFVIVAQTIEKAREILLSYIPSLNVYDYAVNETPAIIDTMNL